MKVKQVKQIQKIQKIDDMMLQLRQLINQSSSRKSLFNKNNLFIQQQSQSQSNQNNNNNKTIKNKINIDQLIQQSSRLIDNKNKQLNRKVQIKGKILAASQLLKGQRQLIKNYVKQKIQSQLFNSQQQQLKLNKSQLFRLQQEKQALIYQKQLSLQRQLSKRKLLVSSVKQFHSNSRVKVDVHQINNLIYQQQPQSTTYLVGMLKNQNKKVSSKNNQVKNSNLYISQLYNIHQNQKKLTQSRQLQQDIARLRQYGDTQFTEIIQQTQTHTNYIDPKTYGLKKVLHKYPHLVTIFYQYLKNQYAIMSVNSFNFINTIPDESQPTQIISQGHIWKNQKKKIQLKNKIIKRQQTINQISQKFKFKGFGIIQQNKIQFERQNISQRVINKMIGESKDFHAKMCILTKKQLAYFNQNQSQKNYCLLYFFPEKTKYIELQLQRINNQNFTKQEGSFFSKKQIDSDLITLKGKNRAFKFENNVLEGVKLVEDLKMLMATKVYDLCCKANGINNLPLLHFIHNQNSRKLNLSSEFMIPIQSFIKKQNRELFIKIVADLFKDRKEIVKFSLQKSKLLSSQISEIIKQSKRFVKLKQINLSHLRLTKQNFQQICQLVNDIQNTKAQIQVVLSDCRLDDDSFISNIGVFTSFCSKVQKFNISNNLITAKTVQIIKGCLENINSQIKTLNISDCPIRDLSKINSLIKQSRKLEVLNASNCSLGFGQKSLQEMTKFFDFLKKCNPNFKKIVLSRNGSLSKQVYAFIQNNWSVQTIEELIIDLNFKKFQLKGQKQLLRTDNVATQKNILSMKLFINQ